MLVPQGGVVVRNGIAELRLIFAVEHQRDAELGRHLGRQLFLAQNKGLEGVEQVFGSQTGEQTVGLAVGGAKVVVKAGVDPGLHIFPAPGGVNVGRPGDGEGMHAVLVFQKVRGVKAVLAAGAGHQTVVAAVSFAVLVAQVPQLPLPLGPVDAVVGLVVAGVAGIADAVLLNDHGFFDAVTGVLELIAGIGLLVAHDTFLAEPHLPGQAVVGLQLVLRNVRGVLAVINFHISWQLFHILTLHSYT